MDTDNFLWFNGFYYFLDGGFVGMAGGMDIHNIMEHGAEILVFGIGLHLLRNLVVAIPRGVNEQGLFLWQFAYKLLDSIHL